MVWRVNDPGYSWKNRPVSKRAKRGFAVTRFLWIGPGELVVLDLVRTGRVGIEAVLLCSAVALAACVPVTSARLGIRAGLDLVARLVFLPSHSWSVAVIALDAVLIAGAWFSAGRAGRAGDGR